MFVLRRRIDYNALKVVSVLSSFPVWVYEVFVFDPFPWFESSVRQMSIWTVQRASGQALLYLEFTLDQENRSEDVSIDLAEYIIVETNLATARECRNSCHLIKTCTKPILAVSSWIL